jgi:hypothetical protein
VADEAGRISLYRGFMRGANGRYGALGAGLAAAAMALAACSASPLESTEVPKFPTADTTASAAPGADEGVLPNDCAKILSVADLEALLGLPLGSVDLRTTLGVAEPSVGRTERVVCQYTASAGGRARGRTLLDVNASAYTDAAAAAKQWRINADAEDGGRRELPIGSASAVLLERRGEAVLMVVNGASNVTVVLPDQPLPDGRPPADVLVDLALRVLPAVTVTAAPPATPPAGSVPGSAGAAS